MIRYNGAPATPREIDLLLLVLSNSDGLELPTSFVKRGDRYGLTYDVTSGLGGKITLSIDVHALDGVYICDLAGVMALMLEDMAQGAAPAEAATRVVRVPPKAWGLLSRGEI